jgi:uncharacterized protein (DUF58 family)
MNQVVPAPRLLWVCALIVAPFLTALGLGAQWANLLLPFIVIAVVLVVLDLFRGRKIVGGLDVSIPRRINLFMGRPAEFEVRLKSATKRKRLLRVGLNLPRELKSDSEVIDIALPEAESSTLGWKCEATKRGTFQITSAHLEIESPWRFWNVRGARPVGSEVRVYPDLLSERKNLARVFLRRGAFGARAQRQVGKGRDFEKLREYLPGDPIEEIHWKASAKRGHLVTKVFQIERTQEVYVAIDCSRLSNRCSSEESGGVTTLDRFVTTGLLIGLAAEQQGDHFGLITFSDQVHSLIRARNGKAHFGLCRDALFNLEPRLVTPDYEELFSAIRLRLRKRALILILTALDDPLLAESFSKSLELVSRQHLLFVSMIEPGRVAPMFKTPEETDAEVYQSLAGHMIWRKLREVEKMLAWRGVRFSVLANESLAPGVISQYLEIKQRQLL